MFLCFTMVLLAVVVFHCFFNIFEWCRSRHYDFKRFSEVFYGVPSFPTSPRMNKCCFFIVFLVFSNICHRCPMFFGHSPRLPALSKPCFLMIYLVIVNAFHRFLMLSNYCTSLPALTSLAFVWYILLFSMLSIGFQRFQIIARVPPH